MHFKKLKRNIQHQKLEIFLKELQMRMQIIIKILMILQYPLNQKEITITQTINKLINLLINNKKYLI